MELCEEGNLENFANKLEDNIIPEEVFFYVIYYLLFIIIYYL
jgi:hypothetical protein